MRLDMDAEVRGCKVKVEVHDDGTVLASGTPYIPSVMGRAVGVLVQAEREKVLGAYLP